MSMEVRTVVRTEGSKTIEIRLHEGTRVWLKPELDGDGEICVDMFELERAMRFLLGPMPQTDFENEDVPA